MEQDVGRDALIPPTNDLQLVYFCMNNVRFMPFMRNSFVVPDMSAICLWCRICSQFVCGAGYVRNPFVLPDMFAICLFYRIRSQFVCDAGYVCLQFVWCTGYNVEYQDVRRACRTNKPRKTQNDRVVRKG